MTPIYHGIILHAEANGGNLDLQHKVWDPTPWVIDVYMGALLDDRSGLRMDEYAIREWCEEHLGAESRPIHDRPGAWHRASFAIDGWTWIGFDTYEHMAVFILAWPDNIKDIT